MGWDAFIGGMDFALKWLTTVSIMFSGYHSIMLNVIWQPEIILSAFKTSMFEHHLKNVALFCQNWFLGWHKRVSCHIQTKAMRKTFCSDLYSQLMQEVTSNSNFGMAPSKSSKFAGKRRSLEWMSYPVKNCMFHKSTPEYVVLTGIKLKPLKRAFRKYAAWPAEICGKKVTAIWMRNFGKNLTFFTAFI